MAFLRKFFFRGGLFLTNVAVSLMNFQNPSTRTFTVSKTTLPRCDSSVEPNRIPRDSCMSLRASSLNPSTSSIEGNSFLTHDILQREIYEDLRTRAKVNKLIVYESNHSCFVCWCNQATCGLILKIRVASQPPGVPTTRLVIPFQTPSNSNVHMEKKRSQKFKRSHGSKEDVSRGYFDMIIVIGKHLFGVWESCRSNPGQNIQNWESWSPVEQSAKPRKWRRKASEGSVVEATSLGHGARLSIYILFVRCLDASKAQRARKVILLVTGWAYVPTFARRTQVHIRSFLCSLLAPMVLLTSAFRVEK